MPEQYSYDLDAQKYDYAEGERQTEAYFFRNATFPAVAVRVVMVVSGTDDYTGRFDYYVKYRNSQGRSMATYQESVSRWLIPLGGSIYNEQALVFIANQHF